MREHWLSSALVKRNGQRLQDSFFFENFLFLLEQSLSIYLNFLDELFLKKKERLLMPKSQRFEIDIEKICGIAPIV